MQIISVGKENKFVVPDTIITNGYPKIGIARFRWGDVGVNDDLVLQWGGERIQQKSVPYQGTLNGELHNTKGVFVFLRTKLFREEFYYAFQEKESDDHTGKKVDDFSVVAESRHPEETNRALFDRALREEAGLNADLVRSDGRIGYYALKTPSGVIWVHAVVGSVDPAILQAVHVASQDEETFGELWMPKEVLLGTAVRDGIQSMMADIHADRRNVIGVGSQALRETDVIFEYGK